MGSMILLWQHINLCTKGEELRIALLEDLKSFFPKSLFIEVFKIDIQFYHSHKYSESWLKTDFTQNVNFIYKNAYHNGVWQHTRTCHCAYSNFRHFLYHLLSNFLRHFLNRICYFLVLSLERKLVGDILSHAYSFQRWVMYFDCLVFLDYVLSLK